MSESPPGNRHEPRELPPVRSGVRLAIVLCCVVVLAAAAWTLRGGEASPGDASGARPADASPRVERGTAARASRAAAPDAPPPVEEDIPPPPDPDEPARVPVRLTVVAGDTGEPVADAFARVWTPFRHESGVEGRTDDAGRADIAGLRVPPHELEAFVRADGFVAARVLRVREEEDGERTVVRLVRGRPLDGRVVHAVTGAAVAGAEVFAWDTRSRDEIDFDPSRTEGTGAAGMVTDSRGRFRVSGRPPNHAVLVVARAPGLGLASMRLEPDDASTECVLRVGGGAAIVGTATFSDGSPADGARIWAVDADDEDEIHGAWHHSLWSGEGPSLNAVTTAGPDGRFRIEGLDACAEYVAVAELRGPGHAEGLSSAVALATPGDVARADVTLVRAARLAGAAFAPDGTPAAISGVELVREGKPLPVDALLQGSSFSISEGAKFDLGLCAPGRHRLLVSARGPWSRAHVPLDLEEGETRDVEVRFREGVPLRGVVVTDDGGPASRCTIAAEGCARSESALDGSFALLATDDAELTATVIDREGRYLPAEFRARPGGDAVRVVVRRRPEVRLRLVTDGDPPELATLCVRTATHVERARAAVGSDGTVDIPFAPASGLFDVLVDADGEFAPVFLPSVRAPHDAPTDLGSVTLGRGWTARGRVLDARGVPADHATVTVRGPWGSRERTTDAAGRFEIGRLPADAAAATVRLPGHVTLRTSLRCDADTDLRCEAGIAVTVVVRGAEGRTAPGAALAFLSPSADPRDDADRDADAWTAARGETRVRLPPGTFDVWTWVSDTRWRSGGFRLRSRRGARLGRIVVAAGGPARFEFALPPR